MDARNNDFPIQSEYTYVSSVGPAISARDILATLRREWRFPLFGCLIGLTLGVCYIIFVPTLYKSSARIMLDRSVTRYLQTNKIVDDPTYDEAEIASQVYILSSESIVVPVVRSMNLAHYSEFVGQPNAGGAQILERIKNVRKLIKQFIGWNDRADADPNAVLEETAVGTFLKRLSVYREDVANVINVTFDSEDPNKAANIANAVADTYIATTLETKLKSANVVSQWLQKRMDELRKSIRDEEQRVADSYANEYQIAKTRESELASTMAQLVGEVGTSSQAQVNMRKLESSPDTLRNLYNSLLQKFKEINTIQTETIPVQNARILTRAAPPQHKSSKKAAAVVAGSIMVGLFLGAGAAVAREWAADVFRTPQAVEEVTGIPCVILPTVQPNWERTALFQGGAKSMLVEEFVLDAPFSRFTEELLYVKALINSVQIGDSVTRVGDVTS